MSLEKLEYQDDGRVLYRGGTRFHPGLRRDYQLTSGVELLAMLVAHIALRYESRIHTYGAISTTIRKQLGWVDRKGQSTTAPTTELLTDQEDAEFVRLRRKNWARLIAKVWKDDPKIFEGCGQKIRVVSASPPHQNDVIEKTLRANPETYRAVGSSLPQRVSSASATAPKRVLPGRRLPASRSPGGGRESRRPRGGLGIVSALPHQGVGIT